MFPADETEDAPEGTSDIEDVYGRAAAPEPPAVPGRRPFLPWHHPVKQVVRHRQWAALTRRLISDGVERAGVLRYFTLPGPDLLDVRVLADVCAPLGVKIRYFGFNSSTTRGSGDAEDSVGTTAESALRQAERITDDSEVSTGSLEDIAIANSTAASALSRQETFDVVNIDACNHLAYAPPGRSATIFDALRAMLQHQMLRRRPWLLLITTRTEPGLLGEAGTALQHAITENVRQAPGFSGALAEVIGVNPARLATDITRCWAAHDQNFLTLFSIGLGKYLLQFFAAQPNVPADVELASVYAYRVRGDAPDMLSLAFRIVPDEPRVYPPSAGGAAPVPLLEPARAIEVARRAQRIWDLDAALEEDSAVLSEAVAGTAALLRSADYDIAAWREWLAHHERRPIALDRTAMA